MEQENKKKRARDEQNDIEINTSRSSSSSSSSKKKKQNNLYYNEEDEDDSDMMFRKMEPDVKVFDFPWLKEGMISKSDDDWKFEDSFSSLLDDDYCNNIAGALDVSLTEQAHCNLQCACQEPVDPTDDHRSSEDDVVENVDGIWSSLINQPLSAGFINDRGV